VLDALSEKQIIQSCKSAIYIAGSFTIKTYRLEAKHSRTLGNEICERTVKVEIPFAYLFKMEFSLKRVVNFPCINRAEQGQLFWRVADLESYRAAMEKLSPSSKNTLWITSLRFQSAVLARDWKNAKAILTDSSHNELYFRFSPYSWANSLVPRGCHEIWLGALQGGRLINGGQFGSVRDQLKQKAEVQLDDPGLMSVLGLIDAVLGRKEEAIQEARRAAEMLPISNDAVEGPPLVSKLAIVYAWTNEPDLAFQELTMSVEIPGGVHYGELQLDPAWDPLRKDPRFAKLLAELAPKE
jgi:hypothetical protein